MYVYMYLFKSSYTIHVYANSQYDCTEYLEMTPGISSQFLCIENIRRGITAKCDHKEPKEHNNSIKGELGYQPFFPHSLDLPCSNVLTAQKLCQTANVSPDSFVEAVKITTQRREGPPDKMSCMGRLHFD